MALDSVLLTPIIPNPPRSAPPPSADSPGGADVSSMTGTAGSPGQSASSNSSDAPRSDTASTNHGTADSAAGSSSHSGDATQSASKGPLRTAAQSGAAAEKAKSRKEQHARPNASPTQAGNRASTTKDAADPAPGQGRSFMETLAQSQADAAANADPIAAASSQEDTGKSVKTKTEAVSGPPSFELISQSLAAAVAGIQTPPAPQSQPATERSTTAADDSTNVMSSASNSASQIATVANVADDVKAAPAATFGTKSDATAPSTAIVDNNSLSTTAFQAHIGISSHFQHPAATEAPVGKVDAPVGSAGFREELGDKITWMADQRLQSASLQLSPEHLGPLHVRISLQDGAATVSFNAMHADTRAALEQALPRLREMFATHGLTLADASVSQQSPRGQGQKQPVGAIGSTGRVSDEANSTALASAASVRLGLLDTYA